MKYDRPMRVMLDAADEAYVLDECQRLGITVSAYGRQCVRLRRSSQERAAAIDREIAATEAGAY